MANKEMGPRFSSIDAYANKKQVARALGFSSIDGIWQEILQYRSVFAANLNLSSVEQSAYQFVQTPYIVNLISSFENKLNKILIKYSSLTSEQQNEFNKLSYTKVLQSIARKYNLQIENEGYFRHLINGDISAIPPNEVILLNYLNALKLIKTKSDLPLDIDYAAELYSQITGNFELTKLYRDEDLLGMNQKILVNPDFNPAPPAMIENMMEQLYAFSGDRRVSKLVRAVVSAYQVQQMLPFDYFSEEMGVLFLKAILAHEDLEMIATNLNFEVLLIENSELQKTILEVKRTHDITYYIDAVFNLISLNLEQLIEDLNLAQIAKIKEEQYTLDELVEKVVTVSDDTHQENKEEEVEKVNPSRVVEPPGLQKESLSELALRKDTAISHFSVGYNEREAQLLEQHLIESDPRIKKSEAAFYARHCTMEKYYTIEQFKLASSCAYETARKSMDNLVFLGYYRKEMIKNKFIYTPIKKKGFEK